MENFKYEGRSKELDLFCLEQRNVSVVGVIIFFQYLNAIEKMDVFLSQNEVTGQEGTFTSFFGENISEYGKKKKTLLHCGKS